MLIKEQTEIIQDQIIEYCNKNLPVATINIEWSPIPFSGEWGISTSFFKLAATEAKQLTTNGIPLIPIPERAQQIASEIAALIGVPAGFSRVEPVNGYLNLYFISEIFSEQVIDEILSDGDSYGCKQPNGELVMFEFSQPNTHKAFHVGHVRSAILGDVLSRIFKCAGFQVVRANYYGDIGLHVIKWLWNYINFHQGEKPPSDTTRWMGELYAEAIKRLEENPELETEVRELYARWDQEDPQIVNLWRTTRQWSIDGFKDIYEKLDIEFDRDYSNSDVEKPGKQFVNELIKIGIAEDERPGGPVIVRIDDLLGLKKEKYRVLVILRSDGTALYSTEDLALVNLKFSEYQLDHSYYVVDVRQSLHFQQVFKTLEIAGYNGADRCQHIPYELVNLPGNVIMASREGTVVLLEDLIREAISRAYNLVEEKNPGLSPEIKKEIARAVGIGAIKFPILARENTKVVTFDWKSALDFNGQAAPYIQYAHVRANSILRQINDEPEYRDLRNYELHPTEVQLIDYLSRLPSEVQRAAEEFKPLIITNLAYETARAFNDFYNQCPVLKAEPVIREFRLKLVSATRQVLANELKLLGITAPQLM